MEFTFDMNYNLKAMTAMEKAIRCGLQEEQNKKSKIIGWVFVVLTVLILLFSETFGWMQIAASVFITVFAAYLIWQDQINGYFAMKKLPKDMRTGQWLFREDGYFSNTKAGESDYSYENIFMIAETQQYILLVFHEGKAQIIDLNTIQGGTIKDFKKLLRRQTNLTIQEV